MRTSFALRAVLAAAVLGAGGLAACTANPSSPSSALPTSGTVTVTGFDRVSPALGSSGPVTVTLTRAQARELAALVAALGHSPTGRCMEDDVLFRIAATSTPGGAVTWRASGDVCPGTLSIASHGVTSSRSDRSCALVRFLDARFPRGAAAGTRAYGSVCSLRD